MKTENIQALLSFLKDAEQLKSTLRSARTATGRQESTAEHTWRLCLLAMLLENEYQDLDMHKVLKICIIHDLGEAINGDIPAVEQTDSSDKAIEERQDLLTLLSHLPDRLKNEILSLWDEYENAASREARLAKALDKIETLVQHTQGLNPDDFNYGFNLDYGKKYTCFDNLTLEIRRAIDKDTQMLGYSNGTCGKPDKEK